MISTIDDDFVSVRLEVDPRNGMSEVGASLSAINHFWGKSVREARTSMRQKTVEQLTEAGLDHIKLLISNAAKKNENTPRERTAELELSVGQLGVFAVVLNEFSNYKDEALSMNDPRHGDDMIRTLEGEQASEMVRQIKEDTGINADDHKISIDKAPVGFR